MKLKPIPKGKTITGSITKFCDKRFLSSIDLIGQGNVFLVIDRIEKHDRLEYQNGTSAEDVLLLYFKGSNKPLALNITNIKSLIKFTGTNNIEDWIGIKVPFFAEPGVFFGKKDFAVRVFMGEIKEKSKKAQTENGSKLKPVDKPKEVSGSSETKNNGGPIDFNRVVKFRAEGFTTKDLEREYKIKEDKRSKVKPVGSQDKPIFVDENLNIDPITKSEMDLYFDLKTKIGNASVDAYLEMRGVNPQTDKPFLSQILKNPEMFAEAVKKYNKVCEEAAK